MKLLHLADLHLGKRVNEVSMIDDQSYILDKILQIVKTECPDAVLIAGDIYDKTVPSAESVELFDRFLVRLSQCCEAVFIISGNHDSPERIAFGGRLMEHSGVYLSPVYSGEVKPICLSDAHGAVDFFLLPFLKPAQLRRFFPDEEIASYTDAMRIAIAQMPLDPSRRSVLLAHQFVTGATRSDSEEIYVGGTENVDARVFDGFDYVALGHLHAPQSVGRESLRYCGSPLKYSFSEAAHKKSVSVVELGEKGSMELRLVPLVPLRELREIRGSFGTMTDKDYYSDGGFREDYLHITLTDEEDIPNAMGRLRLIYPHLMQLDYDNRRTRASQSLALGVQAEEQSPLECFANLYEKQNNQSLSQEQQLLLEKLIEEIWQEEQL